MAMKEAEELLISGLPNHLAILCLIKVPRIYHVSLHDVSRAWRQVIRSRDFYRWRINNGFADPWLVILSTDHLGSPSLNYFAYDLPSRQLLFKSPLPPFDIIPLEGSVSDDYKLVAMNEFFVVLNWRKDGIWTEEIPFLIYNILTNSYKKGASISVRRHSFSCGVIGGKLYITAGVNLEGHFERSTECYDFMTDEWRFMASLPRMQAGSDHDDDDDCCLEVEDDAVFEGQLYLRCRRCCHSQHGACLKLYWTYNPVGNEWREEPCFSNPPSPANDGQLFATDNFLFSLTRDNVFYRFDANKRAWMRVGKIGEGLLKHDSFLLQQQNAEPNANGLSKEARRVFAHGNDIFVLEAGKVGWHSTALDKDGSKYHRLFLGNSSYRAGAVVQA